MALPITGTTAVRSRGVGSYSPLGYGVRGATGLDTIGTAHVPLNRSAILGDPGTYGYSVPWESMRPHEPQLYAAVSPNI